MGRITIFSADGCPHSRRAAAALTKRNIPFTQISITQHPSKRNDMIALTRKLSTPQVFFNTRHVGGAPEVIAEMKAWDKDSKYVSPRLKFETEIMAMHDPTNPRLALPTDDPVRMDVGPPRSGEEFSIQLPLSSSEKNDATTVLDITETMKNVLPRHEVTRRFKVQRNVFMREQAVLALMHHYQVGDGDAMNVFEYLLEKGIIVPSMDKGVNDSSTEPSTNKNALFRLQCDAEPLVLNSYRKSWNEELAVTPAKLLRHLSNLMNKMMNDITDDEGKIDYTKGNRHSLYPIFQEASCALEKVDLGAMNDAEKNAFGINLYNLMIKFAFIKVGAGNSDLNRLVFFNSVGFRVGPHVYNFQDWENGFLRQNRKAPYALSFQFAKDDPRLALMVKTVEPRMHFALNCGAQSCPPVNHYTSDNLDYELKLAAASFCESDANVSMDPEKMELRISKIFSWYKQDFVNTPKDYPQVLSKLLMGAKKDKLERMADDANRAGQTIKISYCKYDWSTGAKAIRVFNMKQLQLQQRAVAKSLFRRGSKSPASPSSDSPKTSWQRAYDISDSNDETEATQ